MGQAASVFTVFVSAGLLAIPSSVSAQQFGKFNDTLVTRSVDGARFVETISPFSFTDKKGQVWRVPAGARVDGASIPRAFWSVIGGPFTGLYKEASVIHDYYCVKKTRDWRDTHRVFYDGMRANGVDTIKAYTMYAAVYAFGPRWVTGQSLSGSAKVATGRPMHLPSRRVNIVSIANEPGITQERIRDAIDKALQISADDLADVQRRLQRSPDCSVIIESLEQGGTAMALCKLDAVSRRLFARRNLTTLINDIELLIAIKLELLFPTIDSYIADPSPNKWDLVSAASSKVLNVVNLTMLSLIQHDDTLQNRLEGNEASGEFLAAARLKQILVARGAMLQSVITTAPRSAVEMRRWSGVYRELLVRLRRELIKLQIMIERS